MSSEHHSLVLGALRSAGWVVRSRTAVWAGTDAEVWVQVQASGYDREIFFINVGVLLNGVARPEKPKQTDCHLQFRIERLLTTFVFPPDISHQHFAQQLRKRESELRKMTELGELRRMWKEGELSQGLVRREVRGVLESA